MVKYKTFLLSFLIGLVLFSCTQNPSVEKTNVNIIQTNELYQTNYVTQTNYVYGLQSNVLFSLKEITESAIVQPYHLIEGSLEQGFTSNDIDSFYIYITNNGFSNNFKFYNLSNFTGIISAYGYSKVHITITLLSKLSSSYTVGLNLNISNIPTVKITSITDNYILTLSHVDIKGYVDISDPDSVTNISVIVSNATGVSTNSVITNLIPSWTNVVKRIQFSSTPSLSGGYNYVKVRAVSSSGIVGESRTITILKSLFTIDGHYENTWNQARLVSSASGVNPYFNWGIANMRVTNDGHFLYIFVSNYNIPNLGDNGLKLSISIDTNSPSGLSNDAWIGISQRGRFVYVPTNGNYPDIQIHVRLKQTNQINGAGVYLAVVDSTNFWTNIANTWTPGYDKGIMLGVNNTIGWEIALPLNLIGVANGTTARFIAVLGKPDGDEKNSAIHILPESPLNEITTNDGFFTNYIRVWSSDYTITY